MIRAAFWAIFHKKSTDYAKELASLSGQITDMRKSLAAFGQEIEETLDMVDVINRRLGTLSKRAALNKKKSELVPRVFTSQDRERPLIRRGKDISEQEAEQALKALLHGLCDSTVYSNTEQSLTVKAAQYKICFNRSVDREYELHKMVDQANRVGFVGANWEINPQKFLSDAERHRLNKTLRALEEN